MKDEVKVGDLVRYKWQGDWSYLGKKDWHERWDKHYGLVINYEVDDPEFRRFNEGWIGGDVPADQILYVKFNTGITKVKRNEVEIVAKHQ